MSNTYLTKEEYEFFVRNYKIVERLSHVTVYNTIPGAYLLQDIHNNPSVADLPIDVTDYDYTDAQCESTVIQDIYTDEVVYTFDDRNNPEELQEAIQKIISKRLQKTIDSLNNSKKEGI